MGRLYTFFDKPRYTKYTVLMRTPRVRPLTLHVLIAVSLFTVFAITVWVCSPLYGSFPRCVGGVVDLKGSTDGVPLVGTWAFWPGEFVNPSASPAKAARMEKFPATWTAYRGPKIPALGYGSYALRIEGLNPSVCYALRIPAFYSAARYFIDGKEIAVQGTPSAIARDERSSPETLLVPFPGTGKSSVTLVVHLSNFNALYPAGSVPIIVGSWDNMRRDRVRARMLEVSLFGAFLMLGAYFIVYFVFRRNDRSCLWFGCFLVAFAVKIGCTGEILIREMVPLVPGGAVFRLAFGSYAALQALFCAFIRLRYPFDSRVPVLEITMWASLSFALCIAVASPALFVPMALSLYALSALASVIALVTVFRSAFRGDSGAMLFLAGLSLFFLSVGYDLLVGMRMITGGYLAHVGSLLLVAAMAFIIMREIGWAFTSLAAVSRRLETVNESLSRLIPPALHSMLGKRSITEVSLGDSATHPMCVMCVNPGVAGTVSMLEVLNDILPRLSAVIQDARGFVDAYSEDGIVALFEDDPARVMSCVAGVRGVLDASFELEAAAGIGERRYALGIHRGDVLFGAVGDADRIGPVAASDSIDAARRLMEYGARKGFAVAVSGEIVSSLDLAEFPSLKIVSRGELPGASSPVPIRVFEVAS